jgi:hypothetical protein
MRAFARASSHCQNPTPAPAALTSTTSTSSAATLGLRRAHRATRPTGPSGRARIGSPACHRARSFAVRYRFRGSFSKHYRQIVSKSRGTPG